MIGIVIVSYKNLEGTVAFINEQLPMLCVPWKAVIVDNSPNESIGKAIAEKCGGILLQYPDNLIKEQSRVYVVSTRKISVLHAEIILEQIYLPGILP